MLRSVSVVQTINTSATEVTGIHLYARFIPFVLVNLRPLEALMNSANAVLGVSLIDKVFPSVKRALHFLSIKWFASAQVASAEFVLSDCQESISN